MILSFSLEILRRKDTTGKICDINQEELLAKCRSVPEKIILQQLVSGVRYGSLKMRSNSSHVLPRRTGWESLPIIKSGR